MKICLLSFLTALCLTAQAQMPSVQQVVTEVLTPRQPFSGTPILAKKSGVLQIGYGIPNNVNSILNLGGLAVLLNNTSSKSFGPIQIGYEYFVKDDLSVGLALNYASGTKTYGQNILFPLTTYTANLKGTSILLTTAYHLNITDKLDTYTKGAIGATIWQGSYTDQTGTEVGKIDLPSPFAYNGALGLRYFASKKIAPFIEASYSNIKFTALLGVGVKL